MKRRRTILVTLSIVATLAALLIVAEAVRRGDLPRRQTLAAIEHATGLRAAVGTFNAAWLGSTTITDLVLTPGLDEQPLLVIDKLTVRHAPLWSVVWSGQAGIRSLHAQGPRLTLRQAPDGRWNNVEATLARLRERRGGEADGGGIPEVTVEGGRVEVTDRAGRGAVLDGLSGRGRDGQGVYGVTVGSGDRLRLEARLVPRDGWEHEANFSMSGVGELLGPWLPEPRPSAALAGAWRGRVHDGELTGRLTLSRAHYGQIALEGSIAAQAGPGGAVVTVERLRVTPRPWLDQVITLTAGAVYWRGPAVEARGLRAEVGGGQVALSGSGDTRSGAGRFELTARGVEVAPAVRGDATLRATLTPETLDGRRMEATLRGEADTPLGRWRGELAIDGRQNDSAPARATLRIGELAWLRGGRGAGVRDLSMALSWENQRLTVDSVSAPGWREASGGGWWDMGSGAWQLQLRGQAPALDTQPAAPWREVTLVVDASGDARQVVVRELGVRGRGLGLQASGNMQLTETMPVEARVTLSGEELVLRPAAAGDARLSGAELRATLRGSARPLDISMEGQLSARGLSAAGRTVQESLTTPVVGRVERGNLTIRAEPFDLLGGRWTLRGAYPVAEAFELTVEAQGISVAQAGDVLGAAVPLEGRLAGEVRLRWPPEREPRVHGRWSLSAPGVGDYISDDLGGRFTLQAGVLRAQLEGEGEGEGEGDGEGSGPRRGQLAGTAELAIERRDLTLALRAQRWSLRSRSRPYTVTLTGDANGQGNLATMIGEGSFQLGAAVARGPHPLGRLDLSARLKDRALIVERVEGTGFGGEVRGAGTLDLALPRRSTGTLQWQGLDAARIAEVWPALAAQGIFEGRVTVMGVDDKRALGQTRIEVAVTAKDAFVRGGPFERGEAVAYIDASAGEAPRLVLERSRWRVADGEVELWGRLSRHDARWLIYLSAELDTVNLVPFAAVVAGPRAREMLAGRVSGSLQITQPLGDPWRSFGEARLQISESDLARVPLFNALYDLLNLGVDSRRAHGEGSALMRLDGRALDIVWLRYRNRGAEIRLSARVADLRQRRLSAITGYALASTNPLPALAVTQSLADALRALQGGFTAVTIGGTVGEPRTHSAPLSGALETVRALLGPAPAPMPE